MAQGMKCVCKRFNLRNEYMRHPTSLSEMTQMDRFVFFPQSVSFSILYLIMKLIFFNIVTEMLYIKLITPFAKFHFMVVQHKHSN